ncbi:helix-turn-helix protein [Hydrogenoanaerobacterium saccharovorans]|uniref:Helix-turn-helix n=2 Tax=Hydrogenoanaerobacterium saccharovorans TaxID=474960 RepID=A0A1H8CK67_9FIRM|nr:helix-turn-helix transcriptional regulator [Hydrogenoanaerobacterium saccharovorans]RPF43166.1 helix-turn-helix protein [Hydrogenoanaerobacterium saccharovorans]SEM95352.1 Helix-turn-helix [Hydrogenoanaerobacterium saccharovorans]
MERTNNYDYAHRMRALREDKDLKQIQIAELLHVGQKTYSDYETRKIRIPLESMIKLAKFYNVDLNYICGISSEKRNYPLE